MRGTGGPFWRHVVTLLALALATGSVAYAHCDTLDGPVVAAARVALDRGDLTPALVWVQAPQEPELRAAFDRALAVRRMGGEARELADRWFFETLVRLHREGEGFAFTGLRPAGAPIDPDITAVDAALVKGSADALAERLGAEAAAGVKERFARALQARRAAGESVEAGRRAVAAYVELTHYVERLAATLGGHPADHDAGAPHAAEPHPAEPHGER